MRVNLQHESGAVKICKVGFSWTTFFFGIFAALFRLDFKWAIIQWFAGVLTGGLSSIIFCFFYNKLYISGLLEKGYQPTTQEAYQFLVSKGFVIKNAANKEENVVLTV